MPNEQPPSIESGDDIRFQAAAGFPESDKSLGPCLFDFFVARNRRLPQICGIQPNVMIRAVVMKRASLLAEMLLEVRSMHCSSSRLRRGQLLHQFLARLIQSDGGVASIFKRFG